MINAILYMLQTFMYTSYIRCRVVSIARALDLLRWSRRAHDRSEHARPVQIQTANQLDQTAIDARCLYFVRCEYIRYLPVFSVYTLFALLFPQRDSLYSMRRMVGGLCDSGLDGKPAPLRRNR